MRLTAVLDFRHARPVIRPAARPAPPPRRPRLPAATDFAPLSGRRVLAVLDEDNLRISLRTRHGRVPAYRRLADRLAATATAVARWAVFSEPPGDARRAEQLAADGWRVLPIPREVVPTAAGPEVKGNVDLDLCCLVGGLLRGGAFDTVLVGTSDGDLAVACARCAHRAAGRPRVYALSVPGCASRRLTDRADLFDGNMSVGADLTDPEW